MAKDPAIKKLISDFLASETSPFGPPYGPGVYGVFLLNYLIPDAIEHLVYIGSSKCVATRVLATEHPYRLLYSRFSQTDTLVYTKTLITEDYIPSEKILIRHLRPRLNKIHKY